MFILELLGVAALGSSFSACTCGGTPPVDSLAVDFARPSQRASLSASATNTGASEFAANRGHGGAAEPSTTAQTVDGTVSGGADGRHDQHDCRTAHPTEPGAVNPLFAALPDEHRYDITALGIATHAGSVRLERVDSEWRMSGAPTCRVSQEKVDLLLRHLSTIDTQELPGDAKSDLAPVDMTVTADIEGQRAYYVDLSYSSALRAETSTQVLQLADGTKLKLLNFQPQLVSPIRSHWCVR